MTIETLTVCLHTQSSIRDERYFSSQSQKFNFTQNKLENSVITINDKNETFNAHKELASNDKETINIDEETIKETFTKLIVTKKQIPILTITIQIYKLTLTIMKRLQKAHRNTKIRIAIKKKYVPP